jgi:chromosome segregation ATPase
MSQPSGQPQPQPNQNIFEGPFAAFGQTISGLKDKISQIQAQRVINKDAIKAKLNELGRNIDDLVNQTNRKLAPLAARNAELNQQVQGQQQQLQQLQQQLQQLQQQTQGLQEQVQQLTQEKQQLQQSLEQAQQELQQVPGLQQQVQELTTSIQQKDQQIAQVNQEMSNITDKIAEVNNALLAEIEKLNDLIGNRSNEEIMSIISELQSKLANIINIFNNTAVGGSRRKSRKHIKKNKSNKQKGGYVYRTSKELNRSSSVISSGKGRRTRRRGTNSINSLMTDASSSNMSSSKKQDSVFIKRKRTNK